MIIPNIWENAKNVPNHQPEKHMGLSKNSVVPPIFRFDMNGNRVASPKKAYDFSGNMVVAWSAAFTDLTDVWSLYFSM